MSMGASHLWKFKMRVSQSNVGRLRMSTVPLSEPKMVDMGRETQQGQVTHQEHWPGAVTGHSSVLCSPWSLAVTDPKPDGGRAVQAGGKTQTHTSVDDRDAGTGMPLFCWYLSETIKSLKMQNFLPASIQTLKLVMVWHRLSSCSPFKNTNWTLTFLIFSPVLPSRGPDMTSFLKWNFAGH